MLKNAVEQSCRSVHLDRKRILISRHTVARHLIIIVKTKYTHYSCIPVLCIQSQYHIESDARWCDAWHHRLQRSNLAGGFFFLSDFVPFVPLYLVPVPLTYCMSFHQLLDSRGTSIVSVYGCRRFSVIMSSISHFMSQLVIMANVCVCVRWRFHFKFK